ncbi:MAG: hypothetical protein AAFQ43_02335 [Bacteroidota bacterium]
MSLRFPRNDSSGQAAAVQHRRRPLARPGGFIAHPAPFVGRQRLPVERQRPQAPNQATF